MKFILRDYISRSPSQFGDHFIDIAKKKSTLLQYPSFKAFTIFFTHLQMIYYIFMLTQYLSLTKSLSRTYKILPRNFPLELQNNSPRLVSLNVSCTPKGLIPPRLLIFLFQISLFFIQNISLIWYKTK